MNPLRVILQADPWRKSRLHDLKGNRVDGRSIILDLPQVAIGAVARELFNYRPVVPWIPRPAVDRIRSLVRKDWKVLEYGSGMSTVWFAERCASVHTIELEADWREKVAKLLADRRLANVELELRTQENYTDFAGFDDASFDFVMIDGAWRDRCVSATLRLTKPHGYTYLDNTDFGARWDGYANAEKILVSAAHEGGARIGYFTGFPRSTVVATQGMLVEWGSAQPASR